MSGEGFDAIAMPAQSQADREGLAAFLLRARAAGLNNSDLFSAIESVPRRGFVPMEFQDAAWGQRTVPIACGETLEGLDQQARILDQLRLAGRHRVFEIGTGSGYATAVIARMVSRVHTIERFRTLQRDALARFKALSLDNVTCLHGDGTTGLADGPFDRIIVWAAFAAPPRPFIDQLASGGEMLCAVGEEYSEQQLVRLTKVGSRFDMEELFAVRFQMLRPGLARAL